MRPVCRTMTRYVRYFPEGPRGRNYRIPEDVAMALKHESDEVVEAIAGAADRERMERTMRKVNAASKEGT